MENDTIDAYKVDESVLHHAITTAIVLDISRANCNAHAALTLHARTAQMPEIFYHGTLDH